MRNSEQSAASQRPRSPQAGFREEALRIINLSLEEARTQHPLDVPQVFNYERSSLGGTVPIKLYRAVRLVAFRELLGSSLSGAILNVAGQMVARKLGIRGPGQVVEALEDLAVGKGRIEEQSDDRLVLTMAECATCSGAPNIGEPLCHFEAGFMAGGLAAGSGRQFSVIETRCWGLGNRICRWEANRIDSRSDADGASAPEPLELVATLAGKAALALDSAITIREKNRLIRDAYRQLRESERLKKDLTDMIVHDMRVPLTAVIGSLQTLAEMTESKLAPQEDIVLRMATQSAQTLLGMIDDLLDISKLETRKAALHKRPARVDDFIPESVAQVEVLAKRKRLNLTSQVCPDLPEVKVDWDRIVRTLVNLLGNAIRHTSPGGLVSVGAEKTADGTAVAIRVTDTGEGIPREYHEKIFDKFAQVDSHGSRRKLSTGLGLTFCKLTVEGHGGRIWVDSEPGRGSTFTFTLPI